MSNTTATLLSLVIVLSLSYTIGVSFPSYPFITLPISFLLGFVGIPRLEKALVRIPVNKKK